MSTARRKDGEGGLLGQLEQLAERIERGELRAPKKIAEAIRTIASSRQAIPARRGRPKGAKTKGDTPGVKLARTYADLLSEGLRPTEAAKEAALRLGRPGMDETAPIKALSRHYDRLIEESLQKMNEGDREYWVRRFHDAVPLHEVVAAQKEASKWFRDMLSSMKPALLDVAIGSDSEPVIRERMRKVINSELKALARRASDRAKELSKTTPPFRSHGGAEYFEAMSKGLTGDASSHEAQAGSDPQT